MAELADTLHITVEQAGPPSRAVFGAWQGLQKAWAVLRSLPSSKKHMEISQVNISEEALCPTWGLGLTSGVSKQHVSAYIWASHGKAPVVSFGCRTVVLPSTKIFGSGML